ncbi:hypothetical protein FSDG_01453 [Fusobacterium animalis 7_1]|jgi:hypothetical protein|uniref:Conjugal transfer protein TraD n=1 Tax=Fusobacterium animalis 7_1 TaxID=457405 RepID=A0A140PRW0_9FUSO|nr:MULTISPECIES: hypothetical protein [Fusobacterium]EEO42894.1 hypothetical protein FSDG_01453 [Fusobacterium animalis 7_1]EPC08396.1 hypothetical protein HMPREF9369_03199 [Fusobacterium polymorphum F0401]
MKKESLLEKQERIKRTYLERAKKIKGEIKAAEKSEERKTKREFLKMITDVLTLEEDSLNIFLKDNHSLLVGFLITITKLDEDIKLKYIKAGEKILLKIENEKLKKKEKIKTKEEDINEQPN